MANRVKCVGFSISGRIISRKNLEMLEFLLRIIQRNGWGVIVPLQTAGERHIARFCNKHRIFCVGLFTNPMNAPEFRGALAHEIDEYSREELALVESIYGSQGKSLTWDLMPRDRKNLLASTVPLSRMAHVLAVWPESTETSVAAAVAGVLRRRIFFIPGANNNLISHIVGEGA